MIPITESHDAIDLIITWPRDGVPKVETHRLGRALGVDDSGDLVFVGDGRVGYAETTWRIDVGPELTASTTVVVPLEQDALSEAVGGAWRRLTEALASRGFEKLGA